MEKEKKYAAIILLAMAWLYSIGINAFVWFASEMSHLGDGSGARNDVYLGALLGTLILHSVSIILSLYPCIHFKTIIGLKVIPVYLGMIATFFISIYA